MSIHIGAGSGEIAETVLICGDPLRAKHIAETTLSDFFCYSDVRNMLGFTGVYRGKRVSVQGTGMGIPSTAIYLHELIHEYGVRKIIRIGTCGAIQPDLELGMIVVASSALTDSNAYGMLDDTPGGVLASPDLLDAARTIARELAIPVTAGPVFSTDLFYSEDEATRWESWTTRGVLAVEMETSVLYTLARRNAVRALSMLTVSDNILMKESISAKQREQVSNGMMKLALETIRLNLAS